MSLFKKYLPLPEGRELKMTISYSKGGMNWATSQPVAKGYRIHVIPVKRSQSNGFSMEESGAFTGFGDTLLPVETRQSKKKLEEAIVIFKEREQMYFDHWVSQYATEKEKELLKQTA
jgi:hypothetical protein